MADFSGLWLCTEVENFENFAEKLGISWMMKKVASATGWGKGVKKIAFKMEPGGKQIEIEEHTPFGKTTATLVVDGSSRDHKDPSGAAGKVIATWNGETLLQDFTRSKDSKLVRTSRCLEGGELLETLECDGVVARRKYAKQ
mmetsp:Transcript_33985/g.52957  ORF Transcript_33985/g.52957 Transcript_33985/m.52957 type:complete len:142 (-) Transcript_33985:290-715(-)